MRAMFDLGSGVDAPQRRHHIVADQVPAQARVGVGVVDPRGEPRRPAPLPRLGWRSRTGAAGRRRRREGAWPTGRGRRTSWRAGRRRSRPGRSACGPSPRRGRRRARGRPHSGPRGPAPRRSAPPSRSSGTTVAPRPAQNAASARPASPRRPCSTCSASTGYPSSRRIAPEAQRVGAAGDQGDHRLARFEHTVLGDESGYALNEQRTGGHSSCRARCSARAPSARRRRPRPPAPARSRLAGRPAGSRGAGRGRPPA